MTGVLAQHGVYRARRGVAHIIFKAEARDERGERARVVEGRGGLAYSPCPSVRTAVEARAMRGGGVPQRRYPANASNATPIRSAPAAMLS